MSITKTLFDKFFELNWVLISLVVVMSCMGFALLYSAAEGSFDPWAWKQILRFCVFFPVMLLIALIPLRFWFRYSYVIYFAALILLCFVEFFGTTAMGAKRWISLFGFTLQPSEIMKICVIFALARYFHVISMQDVENPVYLLLPLLIVIVPFFLVLRQPDLGTSFILLMVGGALFFAAGVKIWKFVLVIVLGTLSVPFLWNFLHDYQKERVIGFLNPESDPLGNGYNILQSKIAIGSGGFLGKGFLEGTQSQLSFLPEKQTDFIFTMLAEEFGFLGGMLLITLYAFLLFTGGLIALSSKTHYGKLMAIGIVSVLFLHIFINVAMVMGLIPVVGAPLPFLSYGGTIMITVLIACGLLLNVQLHKEEMLEKSPVLG